jgi:TonB family protein
VLFHQLFSMRVLLLFLVLASCFRFGKAQAQAVNTKDERGILTAGKPTGVWEYYDNGKLGLVINYDSGRVRYVQPDTARYRIWLDSTWQLKRLSRAPRLLGSKSATVFSLQKGLRYPPAALRAGAMGIVVVSCLVHEDGQVSEPFVERAPHPSLGEEVRRLVNDLPLRYIPAIYRGRPIRTRVSFVAIFCISTATRARERTEEEKACLSTMPVVYGGFNEVIVTALGFPQGGRP